MKLIESDRESDREAGMKELSVLAESGDQSAIEAYACNLAWETPTTDEAVKWLLRANEFDSPIVAWNLAMVAHERGNPFDVRRWINRAADLGHEDAVEVQKMGYNVEAYLIKLRN